MKRTIWLCRAISDRTFENFFATLPIGAYIRVLLPDGAARIFFLPSCAATGIGTVRRVAPTRDLLKDALPTELSCRGIFRNLRRARGFQLKSAEGQS